jgi:lipid-A-disaccharide synthase
MTADSKEQTAPLVYLVAGEPSGDALGGPLMAALKDKTGGRIAFAGVGGDAMMAQGLPSLFPMSELTLMGAAEILPHLPNLLRRLKDTAADIRRARPGVVVTIDSPDFNFRLAKRLKRTGIPIVHYVAPSVWAWRPGRARKLAGLVDHLMTLLPFEPPYFNRENLAATFVGHPVTRTGAGKGEGARFRAERGIDAATPLLCVLPGSRHGETSRLLPVFGAVVASLDLPGLEIALPVAPAVAGEVKRAAANWPVKVHFVETEPAKFDAFAASTAALAASGTVALELALARLPTVIAYAMNPLSGWVAKRLIRLDHVSLINVLLKREIMPEFLLERCRDDYIAPVVRRLLTDERLRARQIEAFGEAASMLGGVGPTPSQRAADVVLDVLDQNARLGTN